jgi:hypothetical protein
LQPALAPPLVLTPSKHKPDDALHIEAVWESAYDQIVRPEKAIVLNAYFIRHLHLLGPELGWMYIAFRQAAYSAGGRVGQRAARFTGKAIAALSGSTERTFWNRAARPETWQKLMGLVTLLDEKPIWDESSSTPKRLPRKYSVAMTLPLTGPDTSALRFWLENNRNNHLGVAELLTAACSTPLDELLTAFGESSVPTTVHRLVRDLFADELPAKELDALAERLHQHIQPSTDLLVLTLFFVEHILPNLGTGPGWLLAILRDRCWADPNGGGTRSQVTVQGGYAEMAGWLGLSRAKTVWEWLRDPLLQIYVRHCQSGTPETSQWDAGRTFDVLLEEVPVEIVQVCLRHMHETNGADFSIGVADFSVSSGADFSIGVARFSQSDGAFFSTAMAQISEFSGAICRVFKLLSSFKLFKQIAPPEIEPEPTDNLGADAPAFSVEKTEENRILDFPQDLQEGVRLMLDVFNVKPPERPKSKARGGDFALWINGIRALQEIVREYDVPLEKAMQLTYHRWNQNPFDVAHPGALKKTMTSVLAQYTNRTKTQKSGIQDISQPQLVSTGASVILPNSSIQARMEAIRARHKNHQSPGESV